MPPRPERRPAVDNTPDLRFTAPEICPECDGVGGTYAYTRHAEMPLKWQSCRLCKGRCEVPAAKACAYRMGRGMRESRVARGLSVFEMAARLGITAKHLSDAEYGRLSLSQTRAVFDLRAGEEAG